VATTAELQVVIKAQDSASKVLTGMASSVSALNKAFAILPNTIKGVTSALGAIGLAAQGIEAIAGAAQGAGSALGVGLASQMEMVTARFNAFTKDGAQTEKILGQVREEANKTPFAFAEMANAAAMLLPASKTAQGGLMGLVQTSEILAALNPSEGLEGAAFALREALSGDFVSVMERFNIPRELINRLKAEGVPAAEIVGRALQEMGADMSLVGNLAGTTQGRLSTFQDAIDGLRLVAGKPILEALGRGLDRLSAALSEGQEPLARFAQMIGDILAQAVDLGMDAVFALIGAVERAAPVFEALGQAAMAAVHGDFAGAMSELGEAAEGAAGILEDVFGGAISAVQDVMSDFAPTGERLGRLFETIGGLVSDAIPGLGGFADGLGAASEEGGALETVLDGVAAVVNAVSAAAEAAVSTVSAFAGWLEDTEEASLALGGALGALSALLVVQAARWVATTAAMAASRVAALAMAAAQALLNLALTANPIGIVVVALGALVGALVAAYQTNEQFRAVVDAAWAAIRGAVLTAIAAIQAAIQQFQGWFQAQGGTFEGAARAIGTAIWQGIVNGISGGLAAVRNAAVNLATSALASAKAALGVGSPSKEFEEVGEEIVAGLVEGIEDNAGEAVAAAEEMAADVVAAASEGNPIDALLAGFDDKQDEALAHLVRDMDRLAEAVAEKSREIGEKAAEAAREAREGAAAGLEETGERALVSIQELLGRRTLDRETDARKDAFSQRQEEERRAFKESRQDAEAREKLARDLADAEHEYHRQLNAAKEEDDKRGIRERYRAEVLSINTRFKEQQEDLARRRRAEEEERAFSKQQDEERDRFTRTLEDEALARQIERIQQERDERIKGITEALDEKLRKITENEQQERAELARSSEAKLQDLKENFLDKVGPLTDAAQASLDAYFSNFRAQLAVAIDQVGRLALALLRLPGVGAGGGGGGGGSSSGMGYLRSGTSSSSTTVYSDPETGEQYPSGYGQGSAYTPTDMGEYNQAADGQEFREQSSETITAFVATYGSQDAEAAWIAEHNESIGASYASGGVVPGPYGRATNITAHGGEVVFTRDQLAALWGGGSGGMGGSGGDGGVTVVVEIDGQRFAQATAPYVQGETDRLVRLRLG
jgi:hypothetical protein